MGRRQFPGEFEHLVLAAAMRVEDAYGAALMREIETVTGRRVQAGSLYITIDRLEEKGFVTTRQAPGDAGRGGRPRRLVRVEPAGVRALARHRDALLRMWAGLEDVLERAG
ncbi:MAG: PadR family transcriptional regulator [Gemmatimonadota bacterium]|nr:PadR family transcriptional regulator [Gemmatimonadota bacterium]